MADLLECVIQIKALADTPRRLRLYASHAGAGAAGVVAEMLAEVLRYEAWFQDALDRALASDGAVPLPAPPERGLPGGGTRRGGDIEEGLQRFAVLRAAVVERLEACDARQLSQVLQLPGRGPTTLADLVALALAHDTDAIAAVVRGGGPGRRW